MSAIVGVLGLDAAPLDPELPRRMVEALAHRGPDGRTTWWRDNVGLGHCMLSTTPESLHERQPLVQSGGALALVADARIDNRGELLSALAPVRRDRDAPVTDAELILQAYRTWGEACPERLVGDFAFAVWDRDRRQLFCARDHIGVRSFYYHHGRTCFAFATEIKALFEITEARRQIDEKHLADYLTHDFDDLERTFYSDIRRLPPAHGLAVGSRGLRTRRYWALEPRRELVLSSDGEYEEAFRELFTECVRCRLRSAFAVGSTLSGGLDSSSVACTAREVLARDSAEKLHTFSLVFPSLSPADLRRIDERRYVEAVVAGGGVVGHQVRADLLSPLDDLETIVWHQDQPTVPFNLYLHRGIYRAAREAGARVVLDGLDGDSTVSHGFGRLAELAATLRWPTLAKEIGAVARRSPNPRFTRSQLFRTYVVDPLLPPALRQAWRRLRGRPGAGSGHHSLIAEDLARRSGLRSRDHGVGARSFSNARQEHLQALESPLLTWALESADKAAGAWRLEPRYPFMDRRLMELCLALPADQKLRDGWSRSILRRAMNGILPPEIQRRRGKADLSPNFLRGLRAAGRELTSRLLADHRERLSGFVDVERLSEICQRFPQGGTQSDAMALFTVLSLAVWLRQSSDETHSQETMRQTDQSLDV